MQSQLKTSERSRAQTTGSGLASSQQERKRTTQRKGKRNFAYWGPEVQRETFLNWLPKELLDAPGIDWTHLSPNIMRYCITTIEDSPDAAVLAVAAASMKGIDQVSQQSALKQANQLLRELRATGRVQNLSDLRQEGIWYAWAEQQQKSMRGKSLVNGYAALAVGHMPRYLHLLEPGQRQRMQKYLLPPPPLDLREKYFPYRQLDAAQKAKRKSETDVLTPLYPVLRQLVRLRKQRADRMLSAIRSARRKVEAGEVNLPYHFEHIDVIPEVNRDAMTVAELQILGRQVTMHLILWNKSTWVLHHRDRYEKHRVNRAKHGKEAYTPEHNSFFVQFDGPAANCLWFGDLIEQRLLQRFDANGLHLEGYQARWHYARQLGFSNGIECGRPGLLSSGDPWFSRAAERGKELIFEPESLYRGILMGAALTTIALSNGSRVNELLQISFNKERRIVRTEEVPVLGNNGRPQFAEDGKPVLRQVKLHFQLLLPKGAKSDEERQLFPLSKEAIRLLGEVKTLLEKVHGEIPIVSPARSNTKYEHLKPEHYLFQWDASSNGEVGSLNTRDVQVLLRFILHGLDLFTTHGKPIRVSVHVLRHVMATHARHYRHVPPEVIAHFYLHHRLRELTGRTPSLAEISEYYTLSTEEQRFAAIRADLDEQEELDHLLLQMAPTVRDLEQKNADLQAVYEIWHALHPTAFGHCGCPGLCPRGNDRAHCLGCGYHVEDPEKLGAALVWRESYAQQAALCEAQGNAVDARQARIKVQLLDDMINVMRMQLEEEAAGRYIPVFKLLPSPYRNTETNDENEG